MAKDDELSVAGTVSGDATTLGGMTANEIGALDAVDVPIIVISRECTVARVNRAAMTVFGLKASDLGRSLGNTLAGVEDLNRICTRVIVDGAPHRLETRDGDRCFLLRIAPYTGSDRSQILGAVLTFTNVTAFRASIEQAIFEREYTKAILNTVVDPVVVLDAKLHIQTANRAFYTIFGVSRDETQGISIRKVGNSEWETSEVWESVGATLSGPNEFQAVEIDRKFPIGRRTLVLDARRLSGAGESRIVLTFHDVTERKQAERVTSLLAAIVDSSDDAIISKKLDGTITSWNKGAERLFGYTASEAIGQHISFIIPANRRDEETVIIERIKKGERLEHFDTVRIRKDKTPLDISLTVSPLRDASGKIIGASKISRDITLRKRIERELRESEDRYRTLADALDTQVQFRTRELERRNLDLRELSSRLMESQDAERRHIARELHDSAGQTLVVLTLQLAQFVEDATHDAPQLAKNASEIEEAVQQLIRELRTTSYLLHPPLLDESGISSALSWYVQGLAERSSLKIDLQISDNFGRLPSEMELLIFRLIQESLTNIHRHSGSETALIQLERKENSIHVKVEDHGSGMSPERLAEIQSQGTGVGIRGMRERVRHFHGDLVVESDGLGTKVCASLPLKTLVSAHPSKRQDVA